MSSCFGSRREDLVGDPLEGAVIDDRQDAERAVVQLVGGDVAREVRQRPVEVLGVDPSRRLFPPGLDPVLDRGPGDEDAMIPPEAPAGGLIRQAVLDDQADRRGDDPFGVVAAGRGQVGAVGVEVPAALRAEVLGVGQDQVAGPPGDEIAEVVEGALEDPVAVGAVAATRAGPPPEVAAAFAELGLGQVLDAGDALGGVGQIFSGSGHGAALL